VISLILSARYSNNQTKKEAQLQRDWPLERMDGCRSGRYEKRQGSIVPSHPMLQSPERPRMIGGIRRQNAALRLYPPVIYPLEAASCRSRRPQPPLIGDDESSRTPCHLHVSSRGASLWMSCPVLPTRRRSFSGPYWIVTRYLVRDYCATKLVSSGVISSHNWPPPEGGRFCLLSKLSFLVFQMSCSV
jgi:hypothetical protein